MTTLDRVTREIVDLHDFFTAWFTGAIDRDQLEPRFLSHMADDMQLIPPQGHVVTKADLRVAFEAGWGVNPHFRIQIRDVSVRVERGSLVMATYTEWQKGTGGDVEAQTARISSALLEMGEPILWLHLQETWLPEAMRGDGDFAF